MSRHSKQETIPWKHNEINILLQKVKENTTLPELVRIHRRNPETIKAKLKILAADYYFSNADLFKQIQKITGISEKDFLVRRDIPETIVISSEKTYASVAVNTDEDPQIGICKSLGVSILDKILDGTNLLKSTIRYISTINA